MIRLRYETFVGLTCYLQDRRVLRIDSIGKDKCEKGKQGHEDAEPHIGSSVYIRELQEVHVKERVGDGWRCPSAPRDTTQKIAEDN